MGKEKNWKAPVVKSISKDDEWVEEKEWDDMFNDLTQEGTHTVQETGKIATPIEERFPDWDSDKW